MMSRPLPHTAPAEPLTEPTAAPPTEPTAAPLTEPTVAPPTEPTAAPPSAPSDWYTDTLRTIVRRALDADKPDIKGALAALQLLAETECDPRQEDDVARILRDARRRVIDGKQS